ncbi:hypothetical protein ALT721_2400046 [Alteromonas alvinellae]
MNTLYVDLTMNKNDLFSFYHEILSCTGRRRASRLLLRRKIFT